MIKALRGRQKCLMTPIQNIFQNKFKIVSSRSLS